MNTLTVVSPAYYKTTEPCRLLVNSCKYFNLNLHLYGLGEEWPWYYNAKVVQLAKEITKLDSEYIMVCDADDAFVMAHESEIMSKFLESRAKILVSADKQQEEGDSLYPQCIFRDLYPRTLTPWRYCNSGGYIGKKDDILDLLETMDKTESADFIPYWRSKDWENDQFRMSVCYLEGYPLKIDIECDLFQTMGCIEPGEIKWRGQYMMNKVTGNFPCVVHFNGNATGIQEAYDKCFALETTHS